MSDALDRLERLLRPGPVIFTNADMEGELRGLWREYSSHLRPARRAIANVSPNVVMCIGGIRLDRPCRNQCIADPVRMAV